MVSATMAFLTRAISYISRKGANSQTVRTQVTIFVISYLINSIVILISQSREKNLSIYLVFVREVPVRLGFASLKAGSRFARDDTPGSVFMRRL
jgi:hypothetical protein